jgi:hypothetical protein
MRNTAKKRTVPEQDSAPLIRLRRIKGGEPMEVVRAARLSGAIIRSEPNAQRRPGLY